MVVVGGVLFTTLTIDASELEGGLAPTVNVMNNTDVS